MHDDPPDLWPDLFSNVPTYRGNVSTSDTATTTKAVETDLRKQIKVIAYIVTNDITLAGKLKVVRHGDNKSIIPSHLNELTPFKLKGGKFTPESVIDFMAWLALVPKPK